MSVPHGRYDARRTVTTFPAYAGAKLYCLVAEARVCVNESLGVTAQRPEVETGDQQVSRASPHDDVTELQRLLFSETKLWTFAPRPFYCVIRGVIRVVGPSNSATRVVHPCRCKQGQEKKTRVL